MALIFLAAAGADGEISEEEVDEISTYLGVTLKALGSPYAAAKVLKRASRHVDDETLLEESVALFGEHLSTAALAGLINEVAKIVETDGASDEEQAFYDGLVEAWQVGGEEASAAAESDEEDSEEEEGEEEDSEEEDGEEEDDAEGEEEDGEEEDGEEEDGEEEGEEDGEEEEEEDGEEEEEEDGEEEEEEEEAEEG